MVVIVYVTAVDKTSSPLAVLLIWYLGELFGKISGRILRGMSAGKCPAVFAGSNVLGIFHEENVRAELSWVGIRISMQDYKCLRAVKFWTTLISTQAHTQIQLSIYELRAKKT